MEAPSATWSTRRPAPALAPYVDGYVGYRMTGFPPGLHRGLPSRYLTLIVSVGPTIDVVAQTDPRQPAGRYRCVLGGLHASPALIAHDGYQEGVAIFLTPPGARALLGLPARELWSASLELDEVVGPVANELWERVQEPAWPRRFAAVDDVLGRLLREDGLEPALRRAWQLVASSGGRRPVAEIAQTIGWTRQHFARRFADEYGLSPKLAARVVRFDTACRMLQQTRPPASIAEVASACGYFDQAHLTRDFSELAGCPPARLLAEDDLPSVQDSAAGGGASSAA